MNEHERKVAELFAAGAADTPIPDGLLVVGAGDCMLCKHSMRNNDYPQCTKNGVPITWIDMHLPNANLKFYSLPGAGFTDDHMTVAGEKLHGLPAVLLVEQGALKRPALKYGELLEGDLDKLAPKKQQKH